MICFSHLLLFDVGSLDGSHVGVVDRNRQMVVVLETFLNKVAEGEAERKQVHLRHDASILVQLRYTGRNAAVRQREWPYALGKALAAMDDVTNNQDLQQ